MRIKDKINDKNKDKNNKISNKNKILENKKRIFILLILIIIFSVFNFKSVFGGDSGGGGGIGNLEYCGEGKITTGQIEVKNYNSYKYYFDEGKSDLNSYEKKQISISSSGEKVIEYKCKPCYALVKLSTSASGSQRLITETYACIAKECNNKDCLYDKQFKGKCKDGNCYLVCKKNEKVDKVCFCGDELIYVGYCCEKDGKLYKSTSDCSQTSSTSSASEVGKCGGSVTITDTSGRIFFNNDKSKDLYTQEVNKYICKESAKLKMVRYSGSEEYWCELSDECKTTTSSGSGSSSTSSQTSQDRTCTTYDAGHSRFNPFGQCKQFNFCDKDQKGVADFICRNIEGSSKKYCPTCKCSSYVSGQEKQTLPEDIFKDEKGNVYLNCNYDWDGSKVTKISDNYAKCVEGMVVGGKKTKAFCCMLEGSTCNADETTKDIPAQPKICCPGLVCDKGKCVKKGEEKKEEKEEKGVSCKFSFEKENHEIKDDSLIIDLSDQKPKTLKIKFSANSENGFNDYRIIWDCGDKKENSEEIKADDVNKQNSVTKDLKCEYKLDDYKDLEKLSKGLDLNIKVQVKKAEENPIDCNLEENSPKIVKLVVKDLVKIIINTKKVYSDVSYGLIIENKIVQSMADEDLIYIVPAIKGEDKNEILSCLNDNNCEFKIYNQEGKEIQQKSGILVSIKKSDFKDGKFEGQFSIKINNPANVKTPIENVRLWAAYQGASYYSDTFTIEHCKKNNTQASKVEECCNYYSEETKVTDPNDPNKQKDVFRCYFNPKITEKTDQQGNKENICEFNNEDVDKNNNAQCTEDGICIKGGPEICNNGKDDNCDGLIDCEDPLCYAKQEPVWTVALKSKEFDYFDCVASIKFGYPGCGITQCGEYAGKYLCKCWISKEADKDTNIAEKKCVLNEGKVTEDECIKSGGFCIDRSFLGTKILESGLKVEGSCDGTTGLQSITKKITSPSGKQKEIPLSCGSCDVFCCKKNESFKGCGFVEGLHCCAYGCGDKLICCNPPKEVEVSEIKDENYINYIKQLLILEGKKEDEIKDEDIINKEKELINKYGVCKKSCDVKQAAIDIITRASQEQKQKGIAATVKGSLLDQTCFYANIDDQGRIKEVFTDDKVSDKGECPELSSDKYKKVENLENNQNLLKQLEKVIGQSIDFLKTEYSKSDNLLKNPSFEDKLNYWVYSNVEIDINNYKLTPDSAHVKNGYLAQYVITNLYPDDVLELSGFVKGKDCKVNVVLGIVDVNGNFIKAKEGDKEVDKKTSKEISCKEEFEEFKGISLKITKDDLFKGGSRILVNLSADCEFWVDDLTLLRTKKGTYGQGDKKETRFASYDELCGQSANGVSCDSEKGLVCVLKDNVYRCDCKKDFKWDSSKGCVEITEQEKKAKNNLLKNPGFEDIEDKKDINGKDIKVPKDWKIVSGVPTVSASSDCKKSGSYGLRINYDSNQIMNSQVIQTVTIEKEGTYEFSGYVSGKARILIVKKGEDPSSGSKRIFEYTHESDEKEFSKTFTVTKEQLSSYGKEFDVVIWIWQDQKQNYVCYDDLYLGMSSGVVVSDYEIKAEKIFEFGNKLSLDKENTQLLLNSPNDLFVSSEKVDDKTIDVVYVADTNNKRIAFVKNFNEPKVQYLNLDKKPVEITGDDKYVYVLLIDEKTEADNYKSYIYVIKKEDLSITKKITVNKKLVGLAVTKDYLVSTKYHDGSEDKIEYAAVFFNKNKIISGQADFSEVKNKAISITKDVSTADYEKNSVFIINAEDDKNKDIKRLVYVQKSNPDVIKELENPSKPLRLYSIIKDKDYYVFVISDNKNNDKILAYKITSQEQKITNIGETGFNFKINSISATNDYVYLLSGEKIYRYPYTIKDNKLSIETDKKEELGSKGSLYDGVLALKSVAFTNNNVLFSVSDSNSKSYAVLLFDNSYKPINFIKLDSTPLISLQKNNFFVSFLNNISQYNPSSLNYLRSKKLDKEIKNYYFSDKHYFVVEEKKDDKTEYCVYSLDNIEEKTTPTKINCLSERINGVYVESNVIYALTATENNKWKIYSINKDNNKVLCEGTTGYSRSLLYDSTNKVFWIGVSANPSKVLVSADCKSFIEYKFDKNYEVVYLTKNANNEIVVLVSSKFSSGYSSTLYKLELNKKT